MRIPSPLLKKVLSTLEGFRLDSEGYLKGQVTMDASYRAYYASNFYSYFDNASKRFENGETTQLTLAPIDVPAKLFLELTESDLKLLNGVEVKYGMVQDDGGENIRWDKPYSSGFDSESIFLESIQSAFVVSTKDSKPCGFFSFILDFSRSPDTTIFRMDLPLIYVLPQYRKKTYALDLTFALASFITNVFESLFSKYRGKEPIVVVINSDFLTKGGERTVTFIIEELEASIEFLKETYPHKSEKIGILEKEVGY